MEAAKKERKTDTVKDISPRDFVTAYAAHLKRSGKIELPPWSDIVKTETLKELAPYDTKWYYIRAGKSTGTGGAVLVLGPSGGFTKEAKRNGSRPPHFGKSSGSVARHILQQLQNMNIISVGPKGGRIITSGGQRDPDQVAERVIGAR